MVKGWMKVTAVALLMLGWVFSSTPLWAESSPGKIQDIRKLLKLSGIEDQLSYMKDGLLNSYGSMINATYPKAPEAFWDDYYALIGEKEMAALIEKIIPVYDKHMSHEVIRKMNVMFENPFWEEWKTKMPLISREAGIIGSKWGQELVQSDAFVKKVDALIDTHQLDKLNSPTEPPKSKP